MKKKERTRLRQEAGITTATNRIAAQIQQKTGLEAVFAYRGTCSVAEAQCV